MRLFGQGASPREREAFRDGLLFTFPAIIGLLAFTVYPVFASLYYSFTDYPIIGEPLWIGLENYVELFRYDENFWQTLYNTIYYVIFAVPLGIIVAFLLANLLNLRVRGLAIYRTIFYLPSITPPVASAMLWLWLLHPQNGAVNNLLAMIGITGPGWLFEPTWAKPSLILMSVWGIGGLMIIFLAGLQDVPKEIYEAAEIDGAGRIARFRHVTIPFTSPYLFFTLVTGLIGAFQYFAQIYVMTNGGPAGSTRMYAFYLYENGFRFFKMGYASAMAWILLVLVVTVTAIVFRTTARRVYYGGS